MLFIHFVFIHIMKRGMLRDVTEAFTSSPRLPNPYILSHIYKYMNTKKKDTKFESRRFCEPTPFLMLA